MNENEYQADPSRKSLPETGIFIRARGEGENWRAVDLAHLSVKSAAAWLEREAGIATIALLVLLGHPRVAVDTALAELGTKKRESDLKSLLRSAIVDLVEPILISHLSAGTLWRQVANEFVKKVAPIVFKEGESYFGTTPGEPAPRSNAFPPGVVPALFAARRGLVLAEMERKLEEHELQAKRLIEKAVDWCTTFEIFGLEEARRLVSEKGDPHGM